MVVQHKVEGPSEEKEDHSGEVIEDDILFPVPVKNNPGTDRLSSELIKVRILQRVFVQLHKELKIRQFGMFVTEVRLTLIQPLQLQLTCAHAIGENSDGAVLSIEGKLLEVHLAAKIHVHPGGVPH